MESKISDIRLYSANSVLRTYSHHTLTERFKRKKKKWLVFVILLQYLIHFSRINIFQSKRGKKDGRKYKSSVGSDMACKLIDATSNAGCEIVQKVIDGVIYACVSIFLSY